MPNEINCPICDGSIRPRAEMVLDELLDCSDCGSELLVVELDPPRLEAAPVAEEDWGE
jgi:alpha-aminoadipate carrier protein LysW